MAEIGEGGSAFPTELPTANQLEYDKALSNRTKVDAQLLNDLKDQIVGIAATLGIGVAGGYADLDARLDAYLFEATWSTIGADTTPNISGGTKFKVTVAQTITAFDGGPSTGTKTFIVKAGIDGVQFQRGTDIVIPGIAVGATLYLNNNDRVWFEYDSDDDKAYYLFHVSY